MTKILYSLILVTVLGTTATYAQNNPVLGEDTMKVSEHVWAIMGWPNIGIVVGTGATCDCVSFRALRYSADSVWFCATAKVPRTSAVTCSLEGMISTSREKS